MHPISARKEELTIKTLQYTQRKEIYQYGANTGTEESENYHQVH
jgi:hypothetical protein